MEYNFAKTCKIFKMATRGGGGGIRYKFFNQMSVTPLLVKEFLSFFTREFVSGPEVIKLSTKFQLLINLKYRQMKKFLTFMSRINFVLS